MDVSIIIVNYNTLKLTSECINSVFEITEGLKFEVIVVDNASSDGSRDVFSKDNRINYIYSEKNLGFGRANNIGARQAKGDFLFLLNSDTYLINNAIFLMWQRMKRFKDDDSKVACIGCMLRSDEGLIIHSYAKFPSMKRSLLGYCFIPILKRLRLSKGLSPISNYEYDSYCQSDNFDVDSITGADLLVDHDVVKKFGLFDSDFFMYYEDTEMQHRFKEAGYRMVICQDAQIVHLEGKSNREWTPKRTAMILRSMMLYFRKTSGSHLFLLFKFIFKISYVISHIIAFPGTNGTVKGKLQHLFDVIRL